MAYTYASFVTALSTETVLDPTEANFVAILPTIIDEAEQRCYRDLDLLATIVADTSASTTASQRNFTLPTASGRFVVLQSINILDGNGSRTPLGKVSREVMDTIWPANDAVNVSDVPSKYAPLTDQIIILGPSPGDALTVECIGTIRPAPLTALNTTTFLTNYLPDLFFSAAMVAITAYMRNWGSQSDDPKMALSWSADYQSRLSSAQGEEMRRKFQAFVSPAGK